MGAMTFVPSFLYSQLIYKPTYPTGDCSGQTIIVTGSNVGLGFEAAKHFVRLGANKVILAVRTESKGEDAKATIIESLKVDTSRVEVWKLDMSSTASVKAFSERVNHLGRLDAIVENAGVMTNDWKMIEGNESTIMVNLIGTILLALLVLPKLRESGIKFKTENKLVLVGSDLHLLARFSERSIKGKSIFEALRSEEASNMSDRYVKIVHHITELLLALLMVPWYRYMTSKLLLLFACRSMAEKNPVSPSSPVVINYCNPGMCHSEIDRDNRGKLSALAVNTATSIFARTTEVGGRTYVDAVVTSGQESHGEFVNNCAPAKYVTRMKYCNPKCAPADICASDHRLLPKAKKAGNFKNIVGMN